MALHPELAPVIAAGTYGLNHAVHKKIDSRWASCFITPYAARPGTAEQNVPGSFQQFRSMKSAVAKARYARYSIETARL